MDQMDADKQIHTDYTGDKCAQVTNPRFKIMGEGDFSDQQHSTDVIKGVN